MTHRNQFSPDALSKKADEYFLDLARSFYEQCRRVPLTTDLGLQERKLIYRRFKTWENFIATALKRPAKLRHWSDEQLVAWLREICERLDRIPSHGDIESENSSVAKLIYLRFKDLHAALEKAIGTSVRREVLLALSRLTPPGCDTASTQEISAEILAQQIRTSTQVVANTLDYLKRDGAVTGGHYSQTAWWSLTPKGQEMLHKIEKESGNGKQGS